MRTIRLFVAVALGAAPVVAWAGTSTGTLDARVRVDTSCRLNTETLAFGNATIFSGQIDAIAQFRLSCGPAVAYTVAIDNGLNFNGQRRMANGSNGVRAYVPYQIYRNAARTQVWGSTPATLVTGVTPVNGEVTLTAYGRVPPTVVLPRVYIDTVTVTVNF